MKYLFFLLIFFVFSVQATPWLPSSQEDLLKEHVRVLTAVKSRRDGTKGNVEITSWLKKTLEEWHYKVTMQCYKKKSCNIIADKIGTDDPNPEYLYTAHFDSVGRSYAGANDNASGVAVLLEMARMLSEKPSQKSVRFIFFNGEEDVFVGSGFYTRNETDQNLKKIKLVLNFDMVGIASENMLMIGYYNPISEADWFAQRVLKYSSLKPLVGAAVMSSDQEAFDYVGVPTLIFTSAHGSIGHECNHEACDTMEKLDYGFMAELVKFNVSSLLEIELLATVEKYNEN
jgi:Zn-dependent M28 family amino/carboxypeptidase